MALEKTLVLIKPDGVKRGLMGRILSRFEDAGMKIVGMKMRNVPEEHALKHYTEDITVRRGERVRTMLVDFLKSGPVLAFAVEGVNAIENVRKIVGATEPKSAAPGTIRGDFSHVSFSHADEQGKVVENLIHASADKNDAEREVWLWFNEDELSDYKLAHEGHTL
ncbi:nucleoside-diphosphate kinase [Candidatus Uhrbacteria bacterium]|nr:nucleoside-diphosphate kinase [Candidatus Uhrbacteria bacterium]